MTMPDHTPSTAPLPDRIRASVANESIERVSQFFSATLRETLNELFQNARRAGASGINVDIADNGWIRVEDDGEGMADPQLLLRFGGSGWSAKTRDAERAAGMGLYALARTESHVESTPRERPAWSTSLGPQQWEGRQAAEVRRLPSGERPSGTVITFQGPPQDWNVRRPSRREDAPSPEEQNGRRTVGERLGERHTAMGDWAARSVAEAALYLPIPVTYCGEPTLQSDYLQGAVHVAEWRGLRIGVYRHDLAPVSLQNGINFHGVVAAVDLPKVSGLYNVHWSARAEVISCPELQLTLPRRESVVRTEFLGALENQVRKTIYQAIEADASAPCLSAKTHAAAAAHGVRLPMARKLLPPFFPVWSAVEESLRASLVSSSKDRKPVNADGMIIRCENPLRQIVGRALEQAGIVNCFTEDPALAGYGWYDAMHKYGGAELRFECDGETVTVSEHDNSETAGSCRPERIIVRLRDERKIHPSPNLELETDVGFADAEALHPEHVGLVVTKSTTLRPDEVAALATNAYWDGDDRGEAQTRSIWAERMEGEAQRLMVSAESADRAAVEAAFYEHVRDVVPNAEEVTIRYRRGEPIKVEVRNERSRPGTAGAQPSAGNDAPTAEAATAAMPARDEVRRLPPWRASRARGQEQYDRSPIETGRDCMIVTAELTASDSQLLARSVARTPLGEKLREEDPRRKGEPWYDALPRLVDVYIEARSGDTVRTRKINEQRPEAAAPKQCDKILLVATIDETGRITENAFPIDVAFWDTSDDDTAARDIRVSVRRDNPPTLGALCELLKDAFCWPSTEHGSDAFETQVERFEQDAQAVAGEVLGQQDTVRQLAFETLARRQMLPEVGDGETATVRIDGRSETVTVEIEKNAATETDGRES